MTDGLVDRLLAARTPEGRRAFVAANTEILPVPHCPEIRLHVATEALPLWEKTEEELGEIGLPPPFWAFAWAGGQALARYLLDTPEAVRGKRVLDLGSGSGLVSIAAMVAGARSALAADPDRWAEAASGLNAELNGVAIETWTEDLLNGAVPPVDLVAVTCSTRSRWRPGCWPFSTARPRKGPTCWSAIPAGPTCRRSGSCIWRPTRCRRRGRSRTRTSRRRRSGR